jgi:transcriptional regulator with XRE-family HTH domain
MLHPPIGRDTIRHFISFPISWRAMTAGELVRDLRLQRTMSQRELAERAGTTQAVISRIEQGRSSPTVATLERIVEAMGESLVF